MRANEEEKEQKPREVGRQGGRGVGCRLNKPSGEDSGRRDMGRSR